MLTQIEPHACAPSEKWCGHGGIRLASARSASMRGHHTSSHLNDSCSSLFYRPQCPLHIHCIAHQSSLCSRCSHCAEFTLRIKRATTETERAGILKAHADHLHVVQSYRATQTSLNHLSEEACSSMTGAFAAGGTGRLMKVDVDYVDQAKFKVPRNLDLTKSTEGLWRPQLHTGGILIWGVPRQISACQTWHATHLALACSHPDCCKCKVAEVYIIAEADLPKGSAAEVSLLARGLDEVGNEQL